MARSEGSAGRVVAIGETVVEIMADTRGTGFGEALALRGPFASGAPAIFIDQVARLGHAAGLISCVGDDDFGRLCTGRLARDGVDTSAVAVSADRPTGSAFVRYRSDGGRDFVFNIRHSASGQTRIDETACSLLAGCAHLHVMGSSLFSDGLVEAVRDAVRRVRAMGGTVSFDPNVRAEMLGAPGMRAALVETMRNCDLFLPSGSELTLLTDADTEAGAIGEILSAGVGAVVLKQGEAGASYHDRDGTVRQDAFAADEVDPTGAGDCFGATFVVCRRMGFGTVESLRYACASGARAVAVRGPMEGVSSLDELDVVISRGP